MKYSDVLIKEYNLGKFDFTSLVEKLIHENVFNTNGDVIDHEEEDYYKWES